MTSLKYVATKYGDATYLLQLVPIAQGIEVKDQFTKVTVIAATEDEAIAIIESYRNKVAKGVER